MDGRYKEASAYGRRALSLTRERHERGFETYALRALGDLESCSPHFQAEAAESFYHEATALARELGMRPLVTHCHLGLGKLYRRIGKGERAREHLATATTMCGDMDMRFWLEQAEAEMKEL
jgi:sugar phosphate isomerase/epimerase